MKIKEPRQVADNSSLEDRVDGLNALPRAPGQGTLRSGLESDDGGRQEESA